MKHMKMLYMMLFTEKVRIDEPEWRNWQTHMYCIYGPYKRKDGRKHIILRFKMGKGCSGGNLTYSYSKFLLEMKIGRKLLKNETCDHKDEDFTNDSFDNLQVLTRKENINKSKLGKNWKKNYWNRE